MSHKDKQDELLTIHQTELWARFRNSAKNETFFEINIDGECYGYIQKMRLPFGKCWLYCNRGPVFKKLSENVINNFLKEIKAVAHTEKAVFLRIEPPFEFGGEDADQYEKLVKKAGFRNAHASHQPEYSVIVDLEQSEEDILNQMKQKGRYNIRLAEKKDVKISESWDADIFYKIFQETTSRDQFAGHNKDFYKKMIEILGEKEMAKLYVAQYKGEIIAGIIVTFYKDTAIYYYGASSNKHREVMAPYLLQWHAMKQAKQRGCKFYDFLGIAPPDDKKHPWQGISGFKLKFGGQIVRYVKAKEYVFKPFWYFLILLRKKLKM